MTIYSNIATGLRDRIRPSRRKAYDRSTFSDRPKTAPRTSTIAMDPDAFLTIVQNRLAQKNKRGTLAYVDILGPHNEETLDPHVDPLTPETDYSGLFEHVSLAIQPADSFCYYGGRFIVLIDQPAMASRVLGQISRAIASREWDARGIVVHLTPVIGYIDLRDAGSPRELWEMAEAALSRAHSSLEVQPFRYRRTPQLRRLAGPRRDIAALWKRTPQWLVLSMQLAVSLLFGLGAPFILYAICDALGSDISGPVYIGVVIVLVITATTIWIEGFLAIRATTPPLEPGSAYPIATVIIPAYLPNEADTIIETMRAFLKLRYENTVQIILAYNSPTPHMLIEDELRNLAAEQTSAGRFMIDLVRVEGSTSKAQNVNAAVGRVKGRFVGIFDADHHPQIDSLERAWRWLSNGWDIVQGRCAIRNGTDSWVARMVAVEFEQIYAVSHPGRARFHGFGIFGGSNGFWRTSVLHETRMRHSMLTEDIDSSIRAIVSGYRITGDRDLVSEELAPVSMNQLLNQRLRWAQGWFQVSLRRIMPALLSRQVTSRQKLGLVHLLIWRELFPWYSIQVVPIMGYWVWVYGWSYIHWTVPVFVLTTVYTVLTGPGQILLAFVLARKSMKRRPGWFVEYVFVSTLFYSPFKDMLSRIAHVKEAMREKAWKVTPRTAMLSVAAPLAFTLLVIFVPPDGQAEAAAIGSQSTPSSSLFVTLLGGEAATITSARSAARLGHNVEAANLFAKAIRDVPGRRMELLCEYADVLTYTNRSAEAVPLYQQLLSSRLSLNQRSDIETHLALAQTWAKQYASALRTYDSLSARAPGDVDLIVHRARVLVWLNRPDEAIAALDRVPPPSLSAATSLHQLIGETLVESAREKARLGDSSAAISLFRRGMQYDSSLRGQVMAEYQAQVAIVERPAKQLDTRPKHTVAASQEALARASPGSVAFNKDQRALAIELSSTGAADKAVAAWTTYLRYVPEDMDARLRKAALLSQMHKPDKARDEFASVYAHDPQSQTARTGVADETVALARAAAQQNHNIDAVALFEDAIKVAPERRGALLREYADQLSYTGHNTEAIQLYLEVLDNTSISPIDSKRAMIGLAEAYGWSQDLPSSVATYTKLVARYPDDIAIKWSMLVVSARQAAHSDQNSEAADLFREAIALSPEQSAGLSREYADQLSFSHHPGLAIPFYETALAQPSINATDRVSASRGLAHAYEWSGHYVQAEATYGGLILRDPADVSLQWDLLVVSGRAAAHADQNREAAELFAKAIKLDPAISSGIVREYADQLSFTGRAKSAIPFYLLALKQPNLNAEDISSIDHSLAKAYDWSGEYARAKVAYEALIASDSKNAELRWSLLVVSARDAASRDDNKRAAKFFAQALELDPARRGAILGEYADKLAYSGDLKSAIAGYQELLLTKNRSSADNRTTALALASTLASLHHLGESLAEYQKLLIADPTDIQAALGAAQVMSWAGRQSNAETAYGRILSRDPDNGEAQRGLAQAEDWEGHHRDAQALLLRWLQNHPTDLAARRLLAQSLVWSGQADKALDELHRAMQYEKVPPLPDKSMPHQPLTDSTIPFNPDRQPAVPREISASAAPIGNQ